MRKPWWEEAPLLFYGDDAQEQFGHLALRDPEKMRAENAAAFRELRELIERMRGTKQ